MCLFAGRKQKQLFLGVKRGFETNCPPFQSIYIKQKKGASEPLTSAAPKMCRLVPVSAGLCRCSPCFLANSHSPRNCYPVCCNIMHKDCLSGKCPSPSSITAWPTTMAAGTPSNTLSPATPRGGGANEEGGAKTMISGGGEGERAQKWGHNDENNDDDDADGMASATRTMRQSTRR
jgi:hypothetical protein